MIELYVFAAAVLALLLTPGPTNTLLGASGTVAGLSRSIHLLSAELLAYGLAISGWYALAEFPIFGSAGAAAALRLIAGLYLAVTAWRLWSTPALSFGANPVDFRTVFVTTLLNPKAAVMGVLLLPHALPEGDLSLVIPYVSMLAVLIPVAGGSWIMVGSLARSSAGRFIKVAVVQRICSVILGGYAGALGFSGATIALSS